MIIEHSFDVSKNMRGFYTLRRKWHIIEPIDIKLMSVEYDI